MFAEEVRMILDTKPDLADQMHMTENGMFLGPFFYQYLKKSLTIKDSELEFEIFRLKQLTEELY